MHDERQIAQEAEKMLERSLHQKVQQFKDHVNGNPEAVQLKDAFAKSKVKKYGLVKQGNAKFYMRSLSIKMAKHGFVQHYGINTIREGGTRTRTKPNITEYSFRNHHMNMQARPFINAAIENSGVIPFVLDNIMKIRSEDIMLDIKRFIEKG